MALRRQPPPPEPCGCGQEIAELRQIIAALARAAVRTGHATAVYELPGNRRMDNQADATLIGRAAQQRP